MGRAMGCKMISLTFVCSGNSVTDVVEHANNLENWEPMPSMATFFINFHFYFKFVIKIECNS